MKKIHIFFAALVIGFAVLLYVKGNEGQNVAKNTDVDPVMQISIGGKPFTAIVRDDPASRAMGLSGRESLKGGEAMVFAFPNEGLWGIWMKDMRFSIDIIWLDAERKIVHIEKNVAPDTYPNIFFPKKASLYVVELPAGTIDETGASAGDGVTFVGADPVGK